MADALRVLLIEDSDDDALLLLRELGRGNWNLIHERVQSAEEMVAALENRQWDILISDHSMPRFSGIAAVTIARERAADLPFILISGTVGEEVAVEAMKAGANDYLFKGNLKRLVPAVERELREASLRREARRVAQELHRRDQQLADAQRLARLGTWHIDTLANVAALSEEAFEILGRPPQPALTFGEFLGCIHPEDQAVFSDSFRNSNQENIAHDLRVVQPGGAIRSVHIRGDIQRDAQGWPTQAAGMIQDITERKHAEQGLQRAHDELAAAKEAAEAANRAKDHFLAVLSHELRTPLTPVLALVSKLETKSDFPEDLRHDLGMIRRNIAMEARLIDDLLDLTRIAQNMIELHLEVVDAHHVLQCALALFETQLAAKGLNLQLDLRAPQHHLWADPARLEQVFMNLFSNAVKFTPAGGRIRISSRNDHGTWHCQIEDNGIGIEPETLQRLFNAFEQEERTITRRFGGLGLGLSITKALLEMQQGRINVNSAGRDQGAIFEVALPTVSPLPSEQRKPSAPASATGTSPLQTLRVLLVEDHEDTRRVMKRLLEASDCSVACASSVKEAIALATGQRFEVLVSDIGLPDGTGHDVLKQIRTHYPIRGIAVSGFGQAEDIRRSREAGFATHLTKPIAFNTLFGALRNVR
jgi:signal transduction histidine kinase